MYSDSSWSSAQPPAISSKSTLNHVSHTDALLNIHPLIVPTIDIIIKHGLEIGIMSLIARPLIVDSIGEESVEAEADQKWFADLHEGDGTSELE